MAAVGQNWSNKLNKSGPKSTFSSISVIPCKRFRLDILLKETAELHIFTNRDLLHKKSWSNFVIDIFHGQTLTPVHKTCLLTSENSFPP